MKFLNTLLFVSLCSFSFAQQKTNLIGTYTLNKTKTDFGQVPQWVIPVKLKVINNDGKITLVRTVTDQAGTASDRTLAFGNNTTIDYNSPSGAKNKATVQFGDDRSTLTLSQTSTDASGQPGLSFKEIWSLTDGGKNLQVDRHVEQPDGLNYDIKLYYDKQ